MNSTIEKLDAAQNELNSVEQTHRGAWAHGMALRHLWAEREEEILHLLSEQGLPDVMNPTSDTGWLLAYASSPMTSRLPALKVMLDISESSQQFKEACEIIGPIIDRIAVLEAQLEAENAERGKLSNALREAEELARAKAEAALGRDPTVLAARKALEAAQPAPVPEPPALIRGRQTIPQPALA